MQSTKLPTLAFVILALGIPSSGYALEDTEGANSELLEQALTAAAQGECPSEIMSPMLRGACEQQMPRMGRQLSRLGEIESIEYMGIQQTPSGPAEVYKVQYTQSSHMWMISSGPDGKAVILWSPQ